MSEKFIAYDEDAAIQRQVEDEIAQFEVREELEREIPAIERFFTIQMPKNSYSSWEEFSPDFAKALISAAEQGDSNLQYLVGCIYDGMDVYESYIDDPNVIYSAFPKEREEAIKWYEKASAGGNVKAMICLAKKMFDAQLPESIMWYGRAADEGDIESLTQLAKIYLFDNRMDHDYVKVRKYLERSAGLIEQEDLDRYASRILIVETYYLLGYLSENGFGLDAPDIERAIGYYKELFKRVPKEGSQYNEIDETEFWGSSEESGMDLVVMYESEVACNLGSEDYENSLINGDELVKWLMSHDYFEHNYYLGLVYEYGLFGVKMDIEKAIHFYQNSWWMGWPEYRLGNLYEKGKKVDKNLNKALVCYKECAQMYYDHLSEESYDWYFAERIFS